jgi:hypothetical protein
LPLERPEGDGEMRSRYLHIAVCMLEWQALEYLLGPERACLRYGATAPA